ncbi:asparaginase [Lysinibacillus sp. JK80]|uniref:asparaginase n=1 Tax=Lysinibacillus sp. JK80 TaxID=2749809 RepID=UPI0022B98162|nr:asparaginase [Lysinibacillus sp. JK80]WBF56700.1 asparaginase [Lysinibacillus sp. JK80]
MAYSEFLKEYRSGLMENVHYGQMSAVNLTKEEFVSVGQDYEPVYFRSAAKPFQAIPIFMTDFIGKYGITSNESALFLASQRGEIYHQEALVSLLEKLPINENDLICAASYPLNEEPKTQYIQQGFEKRKLFHNCAGKHLGFLTACLANGYDVKQYCHPEHPLQQMIKKYIAYLSEYEIERIRTGIDGCGAPVFAIPLKNMAIAYLKLARPELIDDELIREAVIKLTAVMNQESHIIAAQNFICTALLKDPNIVAKGGAQGVYCFALRNEGVSFALKIMNGSESPWPNVIASVLEQMQYTNQETIERIKALSPAFVRNDAGVEVGEIVSTIKIV